ncbi:MAG: hypothetical protein F4026_03915 [Synechococcus sp. SB0669_bin_8]|nr:hypothetical protein [Synechococcus sp. SB0669_bin_8]
MRAEWRRTGLPLYRANEACGVKNAATRKYLTQPQFWIGRQPGYGSGQSRPSLLQSPARMPLASCDVTAHVHLCRLPLGGPLLRVSRRGNPARGQASDPDTGL